MPDDPPNTSDPSPERQHELERCRLANLSGDIPNPPEVSVVPIRFNPASFRAPAVDNHEGLPESSNRPPYAGVEIRTVGEIRWICREQGWWSTTSPVEKGTRWPDFRFASFVSANLAGVALHAADLRNAHFEGANLSHADLGHAHLQKAVLAGTTLTSADLEVAHLDHTALDFADLRQSKLTHASFEGSVMISANLAGAKGFRVQFASSLLERANLSGASLGLSYFHNANLRGANLTGAHIPGAVLRGACLANANLAGADMREARMDNDTDLSGITLDTETQLRDIDWNGTSLTRIAWDQIPRLGDEAAIREAKSRPKRVAALREAARAYRGLSIVLRTQGLLIPAGNYRLREQQLERKALFWEGRFLSWFGSWLMDLVAGYGERPGRIFASYLLVVSFFAATYYTVTNFVGAVLATNPAHLTWSEALVLSLSSFHGRGFFPQSISLGDPIAVVAALEAVVGLFIELMLIATFSRRFLGND